MIMIKLKELSKMLRFALGLMLTLSVPAMVLSSAAVQAKVDDNHYQQIVKNAIRPKSDLPRDKSRLPAKLLAFMQIKPGMVVFEQGASGGYTTELLAHAVGYKGKVFAEGLNPSRLRDNRLPQVKPLDRGLIYQIPERAARAGLNNGEADMVVLMFTYHDLTLNDRIDRIAMLKNMKNMLKPGGKIIIADNAAEDGSGLQYTPQLHRIDKKLVIKEFTEVGFELEAESDIYANPKDDLRAHWRFLAKPRHHHRMLLKFRKP